MSKNKTEMIIEEATFALDFEDIQWDYAEKTASKIRAKAPKRTGDYAAGIGVSQLQNGKPVNGKGTTPSNKVLKKYDVVIHNKTKHYRLGHILEFGTVTQGPQPHYRPNHKPAEYEQEMMRVKIRKIK